MIQKIIFLYIKMYGRIRDWTGGININFMSAIYQACNLIQDEGFRQAWKLSHYE
ncbi:MAG: hypothetical protein ACNY01_12870 [Desulfobacteria bacterium]